LLREGIRDEVVEVGWGGLNNPPPVDNRPHNGELAAKVHKADP
jgi:hypothetical protein